MAKQTFNQRELLFESGVCKLLWRKNYFMLYRSLSFCCNNSTVLLQSENSHRQTSKWAFLYYNKKTNKQKKTIYKSKVQSILVLQATDCPDPWFVWCKVRIKIVYCLNLITDHKECTLLKELCIMPSNSGDLIFRVELCPSNKKICLNPKPSVP